MEPYPPEYDDEPPADGISRYEIAVGACHDCEVVVGPTHAEDVGFHLWLNHEGHDARVIETWTTIEVHPETYFSGTENQIH